MKIAFFDTKPYDKASFEKYGKEYGVSFKFFETKLNEDTVELAQGYDGACVFVNDTVNAPVEAGEVLGFVTVTHDGDMLATVSLCAAEGVEASAFLAALNQISVYTESRFFLLSCGYAALLLFGYFVLLPYWRKRRNRKRAKY